MNTHFDPLAESAPIAARWVASARAALGRDDALLRAALETNFAFGRAAPHEVPGLLAVISGHFGGIDRVLRDGDRLFKRVDEAHYPTFFRDGHVYFSPSFGTFGPFCRAAMIIHECVHVFDPRSAEPAVHVSEWDEPRFSAIPPSLQVHNPSAYASFAGQAHHARIEWPRAVRFGAGRPSD